MLLLATFAIGLASAAKDTLAIGALTVNRKTRSEWLLEFLVPFVLSGMSELLNWAQWRLAFSSPIGVLRAGQDLLRRSMMHILL